MILSPQHARTAALRDAVERSIERFETLHERLQSMVFHHDSPPDHLGAALHNLVAASDNASGDILALVVKEQSGAL